MRYSVALPLVAAALLCSCSPHSRSMPAINNDAAVTAAARSLSPYDDGSPDRAADGRTPPQDHSDRQMFLDWLLRYQQDAAHHQNDPSYKPMILPSTLGAAIDDQRRFEQFETAHAAQQPAAQGRSNGASATSTAPNTPGNSASAAPMQPAASVPSIDGRPGSSNAAGSESSADDADETTIPQKDPDWQGDGPTQEADFDCRLKRQYAVVAAQENRGDLDAVAKVLRAMHCPSDLRSKRN